MSVNSKEKINKKTALIVDDNSINRDVLRKLLKDEFETVEAENGNPFYLLCWYKPIRQNLRRFDGTLSTWKGARYISTLLLSVSICYSVQQIGICLTVL